MSYEEVIKEVRKWPRKDQISLVTDLKTLWQAEDNGGQDEKTKNPFVIDPHDEFWGLLSSGEMLSDEDVKGILEEAHLKKAEIYKENS